MKRIHSDTESHNNRRGIAVLWLVIWGSLFLTFFCVVLEIATLWQAQGELNKALDAAALAAVKEWGASGSVLTETPRDSGVTFAVANTILGDPLVITPNYDPSDPVGNPNQNASCDGNLVFGRINFPISPPFTFNAGLSLNVIPAVRAQATVPVQGFCSALFGFTFLDVSASSTAYYDPISGQVALLTIDTYNCP